MPTALLAALFAWFALLGPAWAQAPQTNPPAANAGSPAPTPPIAPDRIPDELADWVPWITSKHPDLACPVLASGRGCLWPGVLTVNARADGADLSLQVTADRDLPLPLPGGTGTWPQSVTVDGIARPVMDVGGRPVVPLTEGRHYVSARIPWKTRPASLPVPAVLGQVELRVDGEQIAWPRIDDDGLRLGAVQVEEREGERLDLEVSRKVRDGVPVVVETLVVLRASGAGREIDLGDVAVLGTRAVSLSATLPARFTPEGSLIVQVRPGTWEVRFQAVHDGPVETLSRPTYDAPWPEVEYWAVQTDEQTRSVNLSGASGVDPARTTIPQDWRSLPVFAVQADNALNFEELRRGEPEPPPNQVGLVREIWVDQDGGGLTVRDRFTGTMHQGWRLEVQQPARLGHVSASGTDQVITRIEGRTSGVELRSSQVHVVAESRIDGRPVQLPAVGWHTDVQSLGATLHLPPGWTLLAGTGIDNMDGSVLDRWTLFDLFFVLVVALATGRLLGWNWGALALAGLVLARHESGAPQWTWAVLLVLVALLRVVPEGWPRKLANAGRGLCLLVLTLQLVPFAVDQVQSGLFPALERPWTGGDGTRYEMEDVPDRLVELALESPSATANPDAGEGARAKRQTGKVGKKSYLSSQVDPSAVVQTGPGVPTWTWDTQPLNWSGPVSQDHAMRLFLLGPNANTVLAFLRVFLLGVLGLRLAGVSELREWARTAASAAPAALALLLFLPQTGWASPSPELLRELEQRLVQRPSCAPSCVEVSRATLTIADDTLTYEAEVHAAVASSWPIPGPTGVWVPQQVTLDGFSATAMARLPDGFLHVRVDPGVHRVRVSGPLPPTDVVALAFGIAPAHLEWTGDGWALDGHHADGTVDASVQIARMLGDTTTAQSAENLSPWLEVHRQLDLGIPWRVRTTIERVGPTDYPVTVKVPILPGEAVTEGGYEPQGGVISATLDRDQAQLSWLSTLEQTDQVVLTAPVGVPWTEVWTLSCSPMFRCAPSGPAPLAHIEGGAWSPVWRVWPSESVTVDVSRPPGVEGQTTTIDQAMLVVRPGRRQMVGELTLSLRSSQGGRQVVTLPEGANLQRVTIDGTARPLQLRGERELHLPIHPGSQSLFVAWQQPDPPSIVDRVPEVDLGGPAVNLQVVVEPMLERWIAVLWGPRWGPVPLMWTYVIIVLILAPLLGRMPWSPLATWQWGLLGLGMTQVPVFAPLLVACWLLALGWRGARPITEPWSFNGVQLGLALLTLLALIALYASIHAGLLWQPDLQVSGGGSSARHLVWFQDRSAGPMPRPTLVTFPMWTWRVGMLFWSLWLAASLVSWLPMGFRAWTTDGWYRKIPSLQRRKPPKGSTADEPDEDDPLAPIAQPSEADTAVVEPLAPGDLAPDDPTDA